MLDDLLFVSYLPYYEKQTKTDIVTWIEQTMQWPNRDYIVTTQLVPIMVFEIWFRTEKQKFIFDTTWSEYVFDDIDQVIKHNEKKTNDAMMALPIVQQLGRIKR